MNSDNTDISDAVDDVTQGQPVCLNCFQPVDPLTHYCPNCGGATGNFTHYIPFVNLRWQASVWGQMWNQIWDKSISILGRFLRFLMIIWFVPILLIGLIFKIPKLFKKEKN